MPSRAPSLLGRARSHTGFGLTFAFALVATACSKPTPAPPAAPKIAAASDLTKAFTELGAAFEKQHGVKPIFSFGSTGLLAKQIKEGGPFDVFAAANVSYAEDVVKAGACDGSTKALYARGRIVVWTGKASHAAPPEKLTDLTDARFRKIAIANPEHAPYGKAAQQVLERAGVWEAVKPKLVFGENIQETMKFAQTGNADVGLVALSLSIGAKDGTALPIDPAMHDPIDQALVVCKHGKNAEAGRAFAEFVNAPAGREVMKRYGFVRPGETVVMAP
jgi:molybdate transport system substrate-binding protein